MPQVVVFDGAQHVFPDDFSDADISAALNTQPSVGMDVLKSSGTGLAKGGLGLAGMSGDIRSLASAATSKLGNAVGASPETIQAIKDSAAKVSKYTPLRGMANAPTSEELQKKVEEYTGEFYKPQTRAGRYAETAAEFVPGALLSGGGSTVKDLALKAGKFGFLPGAASEFAGEKSAGTPYEPYARVGAALAAPFAPGIAKRAFTPFPASAERAGLVEELQNRGVTSLTAGETTGSKTLQGLESKLGNTLGTGYKAEEIADQGKRQFTKTVMNDVGETGMATQPELQGAKDRVVQNFKDISSQNDLRGNVQLSNLSRDLLANTQEYHNVLDSLQRPIYDNIVGDIVTKIRQGGMTGKEYQILRSQLGGKARSLQTTDAQASGAFKGAQKALDAAFERGLTDADKAKWRTARNEYGRLKDIEGSVAKEGQNLVEGVIDPAALNRSISTGKDASAAARGQLPYSKIARAGAGVMVDPARPALQNPTLGGYAVAPINAAIGRALMSRPGQGYTGNQIFSGERVGKPSIAAIAAALTAQRRAQGAQR